MNDLHRDSHRDRDWRSIASPRCTPDKALDFGPTGEISTPPEDQMSRDIMRDFAGRDFILADNDHEAHVRLSRLEARPRAS